MSRTARVRAARKLLLDCNIEPEMDEALRREYRGGKRGGEPVLIADLPEHEQARLHVGQSQDRVNMSGVTYQKCGGGFRVIRKRREG